MKRLWHWFFVAGDEVDHLMARHAVLFGSYIGLSRNYLSIHDWILSSLVVGFLLALAFMGYYYRPRPARG